MGEEKRAKLNKRLRAFRRLNVFEDLDPDNPDHLEEFDRHRFTVLSIDGGGYHVLFSLQLIKRLEAVAGMPAYELFDIVAGSSAGAITAGLMGLGWPAARVEKEFWLGDAPGIYLPDRYPFIGALARWFTERDLNTIAMGLRLAQGAIDPPLYDKQPFREYLKEKFGAASTMADLFRRQRTGVLLATSNVETGYISPVGCVPFPDSEKPASWLNSDRLIAHGILEGAISAPVFAQPLGTYKDAGVGLYDDPTLLILSNLVAKQGRMFYPSHREREFAGFIDKYSKVAKPGHKAAVFSFGTGVAGRVLVPENIAQRPLFPMSLWFGHFIINAVAGSSSMQTLILGDDHALPWLDYRRFNLNFNSEVFTNPLQLGDYDESFEKVPGISATRTTAIKPEDLFWLMFPAAGNSPFYEAAGRATLRYLEDVNGRENPFRNTIQNQLNYLEPNIFARDNYEAGRRELESAFSRTMGSRSWLDRQPAGRPGFAPELPSLKPPFFQKQFRANHPPVPAWDTLGKEYLGEYGNGERV